VCRGWDQSDAAHDHGFAARPHGFEVDGRDDSADHLGHLGLASAAPMQRRMPPPNGSHE
jgi:hypothetical protein